MGQAPLTLVCLAALLGSLSAASPARAQDRPEARSTKNRLVLNEEGFSIELAGGFQLGKQQAGYYLLGSNQIPGLILVKPLEALNNTQLDRAMSSGYHDETVDLTPLGEAVAPEGIPGARLIEVRGELLGGEVHGLLAGYLRSSRGGLMLFAVTAPGQWPQMEPIARQMALSVTLFEPDAKVLTDSWRERLAGFRLLHLPEGETSDPASADRVYSLCADGSLTYEQKAGPGEATAGSMAGGEPGHWEVAAAGRKATLRIRLEGGKDQSFVLSREEHRTYLDGTRYFLLPNDRCR